MLDAPTDSIDLRGAVIMKLVIPIGFAMLQVSVIEFEWTMRCTLGAYPHGLCLDCLGYW